MSMDAKGVIDRLSRVAGVYSDVDLAEKIKVPYQTIASWKKRNSIPLQELMRFSTEYNVSIDWLLFGVTRNVSREDRAELLAVREALYTSFLPKKTTKYLLHRIAMNKDGILYRVARMTEDGKSSEEEAFKILEDSLQKDITELESGESVLASAHLRSAPGTVPEEE